MWEVPESNRFSQGHNLLCYQYTNHPIWYPRQDSNPYEPRSVAVCTDPLCSEGMLEATLESNQTKMILQTIPRTTGSIAIFGGKGEIRTRGILYVFCGLANRCTKPLCDLSVLVGAKGIEPLSPPYQRGKLPLIYAPMLAEKTGFEPATA